MRIFNQAANSKSLANESIHILCSLCMRVVSLCFDVLSALVVFRDHFFDTVD